MQQRGQHFAAKRSSALDLAKKWAVNGDLINKAFRGEDGKRLIIVSTFEDSTRSAGIEETVADLLKLYQVTHYRDSQIDELAHEVMNKH